MLRYNKKTLYTNFTIQIHRKKTFLMTKKHQIISTTCLESYPNFHLSIALI